MKITLKELRSLVRSEVRKKYLRENLNPATVEKFKNLINQNKWNENRLVVAMPSTFIDNINKVQKQIEDPKNLETLKNDPFFQDIIKAHEIFFNPFDKLKYLIQETLIKSRIKDETIRANINRFLFLQADAFEQAFQDEIAKNPNDKILMKNFTDFTNWKKKIKEIAVNNIKNEYDDYISPMGQPITFKTSLWWVEVGGITPDALYKEANSLLTDDSLAKKLAESRDLNPIGNTINSIGGAYNRYESNRQYNKIQTESLRRIVREEITRQLRSRR